MLRGDTLGWVIVIAVVVALIAGIEWLLRRRRVQDSVLRGERRLRVLVLAVSLVWPCAGLVLDVAHLDVVVVERTHLVQLLELVAQALGHVELDGPAHAEAGVAEERARVDAVLHVVVVAVVIVIFSSV